MAESLHCPPETITALLIGYTPVQHKKFKKKLGVLLHTYLCLTYSNLASSPIVFRFYNISSICLASSGHHYFSPREHNLLTGFPVSGVAI